MSAHNTNIDALAAALMRFASENDFLPEAPEPHYVIFNQPHQKPQIQLLEHNGRPIVTIHRKLWTAFDETERAAVQRSIHRNDPTQEHGTSTEIPSAQSWVYLYSRSHDAPTLDNFEDEIAALIYQHTLHFEDALDAAIDATSQVLEAIPPARARLLQIAAELKRLNLVTKMGPTTLESGSIRVTEVGDNAIICRIRGIRRPAIIQIKEDGWTEVIGILHGLKKADTGDGRAQYAAELKPLLEAEAMSLADATTHEREIMISTAYYPPEADAKEIAEKAHRQAELANLAHIQLFRGHRG